MRKPDRAIYDRLIEWVDQPADKILFVDDRSNNLDTAKSMGLRTVHFDPRPNAAPGLTHERARSMDELLAMLRS